MKRFSNEQLILVLLVAAVILATAAVRIFFSSP